MFKIMIVNMLDVTVKKRILGFVLGISALGILFCVTSCDGRSESAAKEMIAEPLRAEILKRAEADLDKVPVTITSCTGKRRGPARLFL